MMKRCSLLQKSFLASTGCAIVGTLLLLTLQIRQFELKAAHHRMIDPSLTYSTNITKSMGATNQQSELPCLTHRPRLINSTELQKLGASPNQTVLAHRSVTNCGRLRRQWLRNPPLSEYAISIDRHQSDCSLPLAMHHFDNIFGLGSHLVLWSQAMCNGMESSVRLQSFAPKWLWLDQDHCDMTQSKISPMLCYFPASEHKCAMHDMMVDVSIPSAINITDPRDIKQWCAMTKNSEATKAEFRAASTEYLFQVVSPLVIQEAQRQIGVIFRHGMVPEDLVTIHIRWGDKFWEMDLPSIQEYIDAVNTLLQRETSDKTTSQSASNQNAYVPTANIYLATEDPKAYNEFMKAKPSGWTVYADITLHEIDAFRPQKGNRASWAARNTKGRSGLIALGSLLVAMEANRFVLTTKSNWSTLMNHLRMQIIDPRCGNCTKMIDLRPGVW
jgi:hypothetical protein